MEIDVADRLTQAWVHLSGIQDNDQFWSATSRAFADIGFDQVIYATSPVAGGQEGRLVDMRTSPAMADWAGDYHTAGDAGADPMFSYGVFLPGPVYTGSDFLADYDYLRPAERAVIARAGDHGFRSGVAVPMLFPRPGTIGGWNLGCSAGRAETTALFGQMNGFLPAFATLVQARLEAIDSVGPSPLSAREREVLLWLGRGERTDQIAHRLNLRPVTVSLHLRNARHKLGARTREQALALSIVRGWINP